MNGTPKHRDILFDEQGGLCYYCKRPMIKRWIHVDGAPTPNDIATLDHKVPRSKGGKNRIENKCAACNTCNGLKTDMTDVQFFEYMRAHESQASRCTLQHSVSGARGSLSLLQKGVDQTTRASDWSRSPLGPGHLGSQGAPEQGRQEQAEQQGAGLLALQPVEGQ